MTVQMNLGLSSSYGVDRAAIARLTSALAVNGNASTVGTVTH